ncbi:unnamed protein product, partial [Pleuronectes platessa]
RGAAGLTLGLSKHRGWRRRGARDGQRKTGSRYRRVWGGAAMQCISSQSTEAHGRFLCVLAIKGKKGGSITVEAGRGGGDGWVGVEGTFQETLEEKCFYLSTVLIKYRRITHPLTQPASSPSLETSAVCRDVL